MKRSIGSSAFRVMYYKNLICVSLKMFANLQSRLILILLISFVPLNKLQAQVQSDLPTGDIFEYYYRLLQLSGLSDESSSFTLKPFTPVSTADSAATNPWMTQVNRFLNSGFESPLGFQYAFIEPLWFQSWNSTLPRGVNDGAIWQGRGYNTALSAGIIASWGPLHVRLQPQAGFAQNSSFDLGSLPSASSYSPPIQRIDNIRRFGPDSYSWFDLGDSYAELRMAGLKAGFSNARIWTGPALHNPLFFSYNAPGFKHLHLSTYRPLKTPLGGIEFKYLYGALQKSDWLDQLPGDRLNTIISLNVAWSPSFADGLTIGFNRVFMDRYPSGFNAKWSQAKLVFESFIKQNLATEDNPEGQSDSNQMASVFYRWAFPGWGLEAYGEFGRNDHNRDWRDFRMQPNHHRAYLLGILKAFELSGNRLLSLGAETTQLNANRTSFTRGGAPWQPGSMGRWYVHRFPNFGFTNKGQILGAGIGHVSQSQIIHSTLFHERGSYGMKLARISYQDVLADEYFSWLESVNEPGIERRQVRNIELMTGLSATRFLTNGLEIATSLDISYIMNQNYIRDNDKVNVRLELTIRRQIKGWVR